MAKSALIVVDMQKGFLDRGAPIEIPDGKRIVPNVIEAINLFRRRGEAVLWTKVNIELFRNTQYSVLFPTHFTSLSPPMDKLTSSYELVDELKDLVRPEDFIVEKDRYSAFLYTNLELILRVHLAVEHLYFAGVSTNVCVESSVRDAFQRGFYTYLLSDCTASFSPELQRLSEEIVAFAFGEIVSLARLKEAFQ